MSHPRYALPIVLILLLHTVTPPQQAAIALDKNDPELRAILTEIEADAESAQVKARIPGMSIVILYDQDVLLAKGFGYADLEKKIPADPQTVYRVGSLLPSARLIETAKHLLPYRRRFSNPSSPSTILC